VNQTTAFDPYAEGYDAVCAEALSVTGEDRSYYANGRVRWLARCLTQFGESPRTALDFGCGPGSTGPILIRELGLTRCTGVDTSARLIDLARKSCGPGGNDFLLVSEFQPAESMDLAYCNGVFHHIPLSERAANLELIHKALRLGGLFALWENNPWNPGTHYVMSNCAFDKDAVTLPPPEAKRLLRAAGFEILRTDFLFIFPRFLRLLRPLEAPLSRLPFGAQYQVLCRKTSV